MDLFTLFAVNTFTSSFNNKSIFFLRIRRKGWLDAHEEQKQSSQVKKH